jgi:hypothetical protein
MRTKLNDAPSQSMSQEKQLDELIQAGFELLEKERTRSQVIAACEQWLEA